MGQKAEGNGTHISVLHAEALDALNVKSDGFYIDATYGRGGHSTSILNALGDQGRLLALDCDLQAVDHAQAVQSQDRRFSIEQCNYSRIGEVANDIGVTGGIDGVLFDLGVSSPQLDQAQRGFSFDRDGPLDMRMDQTQGQPVSEWLTTVNAEQLALIFKELGEERYAKRIAREVVAAVQEKPLTRTKELAEIVKAAHPRWEKHKHPATRCFQALRIFINRELEHLKAALDACVNVVRPGGRLVVISFHSLEDRIVKRFIRGQSDEAPVPRGLPVQHQRSATPFQMLGRAIRPSDAEVASNPRARSSIMRVAERLAA